MPTTPPERRTTGAALVAALLLLLPTACSSDEPTPDADPSATTRAGQGTGDGHTVSAPDVARRLERLLDQRVEAVRRSDAAAFQGGVDQRAGDFAAQQSAYFLNLQHLPVADFDLALDRASLVRDGRAYWAD